MTNPKILDSSGKDTEKGDFQLPSETSHVALESFPKRQKWASKWEYFLSLAGIAIGLGNVWRFPYICYENGGGAFLIPYLLMVVIIGLPIFLLESSLGQFSNSGCIAIYEACPAFKGVGYTSLLVTLIASSYYSVIIAYTLVFLVYSFSKEVPWASCGNTWNSPYCSKSTLHYEKFTNKTFQNATFAVTRSAADEFFHFKILNISNGITEANQFVTPIVGATVFVWVFVFFCIFKGVRVFGKIVWFTSTFPFVMLFALLINGLTLPGAFEGIKYFVNPDFSQLSNYQVWADAASQIFFSLQVGWGSIITMGSYNHFKNNTMRDAIAIPVLNCATSIIAGIVVFSILGFMATTHDVPISKVVTAGPALAFITYPEALAMMPLASLWSVFFFLMLFFLGVDSVFCQIEAMVASLSDEFPKLRNSKVLLSFLACLVMMLLALSCCTQGGMYVLKLFDRYSVTIPISFACLCEVCVFAYAYGGGALIHDLQLMTNRYLSKMWWFCWMIFTPVSLVAIVIHSLIDTKSSRTYYGGYFYPSWSEGVGWMLALIPVICIPLIWIYTMLKSEGSFLQRLMMTHTPSFIWGPKPGEERLHWIKMANRDPVAKRFLYPSFYDYYNEWRKTHP